MPRPLLNNDQKNKNTIFAANKDTKNSNFYRNNNADLTRTLRKKRSQKYMAELSKLDSGQGQLSQKEIKEIIAAIHDEFPEVTMAGDFLGIIAKCYLGENYEVHTLNFTLEIVTHFRNGESLPSDMEKARNLANNPSYQYIEVYTDCCRCIDVRGNVSTVKL